MMLEVVTYIEVKNLEHEWAVKIDKCKQEMNPIIPKYVSVNNEIRFDFIYVDNLLTDIIPEKIIPGVNGQLSNYYFEVGFWKPINQK